MTNSFQAHQAYKNAQRELTSSKGIELKVFQRVTSDLRSVNLDEIGGAAKLAEAVVQNAKLWRILFVDLINPENELPMPLKESLLSLADFTQKHTFKVLSGDADHQVLIDINQSIIQGLRDSARIANSQPIAKTEAA